MPGDGRLGATSFSFWQQSTQPSCVSFYLCKHQKGSHPARALTSLILHVSFMKKAHFLLPKRERNHSQTAATSALRLSITLELIFI
jgi:hypothetical protein